MALTRCSISILSIVSIILLASMAGLLVLQHKSNRIKEEPYYLDLVSRSAYACAEVNNFIEDFDPFYKWATKFSLPSVLQQLVDSGNPYFLDLANTAYQQAGAWRVLSNWTKDGASRVYASAEPHIAGGMLKEHRHSLWRMETNWGISIRMCLSVGNAGTNRSCLWTTPVVALSKEADLGLLLVQIPFRNRTTPDVTREMLLSRKPEDYPYVNGAGFYLTNYASTARMPFSKFQSHNDESNYYLTGNVPECNFSPFYYSPDAVTHMAFPCLQCGCSEKMCLVVARNKNTSEWQRSIFNNLTPCSALRSYWTTFNTSANALVAHHGPSNKRFAILDVVNTGTSTFNDISSIGTPDLQRMERLTACVEGLSSQTGEPTENDILSKCNVVKLQSREFEQIGSPSWPLPRPQVRSKDTFCPDDLPQGQLQFKDNMCVFRLDESTSKEINDKIATLLNVTDVRLKHNKVWEDGAQARSSVYTGTLAAIGTMIAAWFALLSQRLEDFETTLISILQKLLKFAVNLFLKHIAKKAACTQRVIQEPFGAVSQGVIFSYRALAAVGGAVIMLFTVYSSIKSVNKHRDFLQARTVSQTLKNGTNILVTSTATIRVAPIWTSFYVFAFLSWSILTFVIYRILKVVTKPRPGLQSPQSSISLRIPKTPKELF